MPATITFVDGSTITVSHTAMEVQQQIQQLSREPQPYGDWLMLGDDDETYFNPAHVIHVRDKKESSGPMVAFR